MKKAIDKKKEEKAAKKEDRFTTGLSCFAWNKDSS